MYREIKFRAWNIPNKLMYQNVQDGLLAENEKDQLVLGVSLGKLSKDAGSILMQFSGLQDKNGKEIYEFDIVKFYNPYSKNTYIMVVKFCSVFAGFALFDSVESKWAKESDYLKIQDLEVVGNIYENTELLDSSVVA